MSQSTRLFTTINFAGKTYNSLNEVEKDLREVEERIEDLKSNLRVLAYMTPVQNSSFAKASGAW